MTSFSKSARTFLSFNCDDDNVFNAKNTFGDAAKMTKIVSSIKTVRRGKEKKGKKE
jgi:hypothetical protein